MCICLYETDSGAGRSAWSSSQTWLWSVSCVGMLVANGMLIRFASSNEGVPFCAWVKNHSISPTAFRNTWKSIICCISLWEWESWTSEQLDEKVAELWKVIWNPISSQHVQKLDFLQRFKVPETWRFLLLKKRWCFGEFAFRLRELYLLSPWEFVWNYTSLLSPSSTVSCN